MIATRAPDYSDVVDHLAIQRVVNVATRATNVRAMLCACAICEAMTWRGRDRWFSRMREFFNKKWQRRLRRGSSRPTNLLVEVIELMAAEADAQVLNAAEAAARYDMWMDAECGRSYGHTS